VSEGVVDFLQLVKICKKEQHRLAGPYGDFAVLLGEGNKSAPVVQTGQFVGDGNDAELFLQLLALGDVAGDSPETGWFAFGVADQRHGYFVEMTGAVLLDEFNRLRPDRNARFINTVEKIEQQRRVFFVRVLMMIHADDFFAAVTEVAAFRLVDKGEMSSEIRFEIPVFDLLDDGPVSFFGLADSLFHLPALGDVTGNTAETDGISPVVPDQGNRNFRKSPRSVLPDNFKGIFLNSFSGPVELQIMTVQVR
jgi:hypothetical protein